MMTKEKFLKQIPFRIKNGEYKWNGYCITRKNCLEEWVYEASAFESLISEEIIECFSNIMEENHTTIIRFEHMEEICD